MTPSRLLPLATALAASAGLTFALTGPSLAKRGPIYGTGYAYVTAQSVYDRWKSVTAPVRPGPRGGYQVKLPGGSWVDCFGSCSETLRVQYLDYWESITEGGPSQ